MSNIPAILDGVLSAFSHEVRTSLTAAGGALNLIAEDPESTLGADQRGFLALAQRALGRMESLLANIIESGRVSREGWPVDPVPAKVSRIVESAVAEATDLPGFDARRVGVEIEAQLPLVPMDPEGVRRIVRNLEGNALRHSSGSPVTVRVAQDGEWALIEVADGGPGIPPKERERIFERFAQGKASCGGLGLGLYLARWIADAHGGTLRCEAPRDGVGARFCLRLPLAGCSPRLPVTQSAVPVVRVRRSDGATLSARDAFKISETLRHVVPGARRWEGGDVVVATLPPMPEDDSHQVCDRLRELLGGVYAVAGGRTASGRVA